MSYPLPSIDSLFNDVSEETKPEWILLSSNALCELFDYGKVTKDSIEKINARSGL